MSVSRESGELEQTLTEARRMLESLRTHGPAAGPEDPEGDQPIQITGLNGMVIVTATPGGLIERIDIDALAKRLPLEDLSEAITAAVNDALSEVVARKSQVDAETATVDLAVLSEQVQRMQDDGMRQMARFTGTLSDVMARLGRQQ
jgi:hypothetical protein